MITVQAKDMTDEQWQSFEAFSNYLKCEIYPKFSDGKAAEWEKIKKNHLDKVNLNDIAFSNTYYIFDSSKVIAFIDAYERRGNLDFTYDYYGNEISTDYIKIILSEVKNLLTERNRNEANFNSMHERKYEPFLRIGAEIYTEHLTSRLLKKDIDFAYLKKITDENKYVGNYELKLFREIPVEIYQKFVNYTREVNNDKYEFHPRKKRAPEYTMDELLTEVNDIGNKNFYLYMIFDKEDIAAYCSVFVGTMDGKPYIEHFGNVTTVGRNYRGKGFAKYLKAKMYLKIQEDYPDFTHAFTDTYPWNKYMYRINEELGFKPYMKGYSFIFTKEYLENFLK